MSCSYHPSDDPDDEPDIASDDEWHPHVPAEAADLPAGIRALWLRTGCIALGGSTVLGHYSTRHEQVTVVEELCRFVGLMLKPYHEFCLFAGGEKSGLSIEVTRPPWLDLTIAASTASRLRPLLWGSLRQNMAWP